MEKQKRGYEAFINKLREEWQVTEEFQGERLTQLFDRVNTYLEAAGDMTKDELALIKEYVQRDLSDLNARREAAKQEPEPAFLAALKDSVWHWLLEASDRTQIEWVELNEDLAHKGVYHAGEWVGLGVMICNNCDHRHEVTHPERLTSCTQCDGSEFRRELLVP